MKNNNIENDELRGRFTNWLETLACRAKIDYFRRNTNHLEIVSIEELSDECLAVDDPIQISSECITEFEFEEKRLAHAFAELPKSRQKILSMLFVYEYPPQVIAKKLGCTVQHVYNQRSKALKMLKEILAEDE